jgi:membrane protease YdiL (CAAX protease family)
MPRPVTATDTAVSSNELRVDEGVQPTFRLLLGIFVAHVAIWIGLIALVPGDDRVSFEYLGDQSTPWVRQFIIPLLVVLAFQVAVTTKLGWWKSVLRDPSRSRRRWLWVFPVLIALAGLLVFSDAGPTDAGSTYIAGCLAAVMLVGVTEEFTFRGLLLVGGRRLFSTERTAALVAAVLFGLFHLPNILVGAEVDSTLWQVVQTAVIGLGLYALRRVSGSIIPCMVLHGVYDYLLLQGNWDAIAAAAL